MDIGHVDQRLLEEIQHDLPLESHPFQALGRRLGLQEHAVIEQVEKLLEQGIIREISAILDGSRIGYKSTLVAVRVSDERISEIADRISSHPGVSHNYQREHLYNLWFTLSIPREKEFDQEINGILGTKESIPYLILPALKTYKLRVHLHFAKDPKVEGGTAQGGIEEDRRAEAGRQGEEHPGNPATQPELGFPLTENGLDALDRRIISMLQRRFPIEPLPWLAMARELGIDEAVLLDRVRALKSKGIIRRIAGVLRHREAGFEANGMVCFAVPEQRINDAGRRVAQFSQVSHCYHRGIPPEWPYPLFAMVHARSRAECTRVASEIAEQISCRDYSILYSSREFKKERVKYFVSKKEREKR
jgi:DNA-binding Lrp family transcriptional regulator